MTTATEQPQHLHALSKANEVRMASAALRRELGAGQLTLREALDDPRSGCLELRTLLSSLPRIGVVKASRIANTESIGASPTRRVRDLTDRQRCELVEAMRVKP